MPDDTMSLPDRVESTVYAWAGTKKPVATTTALEVLWAASGQAATVPYPDPATRDLIHQLTVEFKNGNDARDLSAMTPALFIKKGKITSIDDLVEWVLESPHPQAQA